MELDAVVVEVVEHGQAGLVTLAVVRLPLASPGQGVVLTSYSYERGQSYKQSELLTLLYWTSLHR